MNADLFYPYFIQCSKVTIDSRKIEKNDIFLAFSGESFNAASLAGEAKKKGALAVIVEQKQYENSAENIFYVPSTLQFLQDLSKLHRAKLSIPVIALTGSNGKTTTKEIISTVLAQEFRVQYTYGNLNNHIGVPLTLLSIKPEHEIAVIELGANHQKEIEQLCLLAKPDYGYITNFGKAHLEGFGGIEGVIAGKSELYDYLKKHGKTIFVNQDDSLQVEKTSDYEAVVTFGTSNSDYNFVQFSQDNCVGIIYNGVKAQSKLTGNYNFTNLSAAAAIGLYFGLSFGKIKLGVEAYMPTNMRSQIMERDGRIFVLDAYNANPSSMSEALHNFSGFRGSKTIIIGDMLELGTDSMAEHTGILELAAGLNFNEIITVGNHFRNTGISPKGFETSEELISYLTDHTIDSANILIKGSRGIALEKVLDYI